MASRTKRAKAQKKPVTPFITLIIVCAIFCLLGVGAASAYAMVEGWLEDVPEVSDLEAFNQSRKTRVYASDGTTLLAEFFMEDREPVEPGQVSPYLFNATIATEDERFWQHNGVDLYGIARATVNDLLGGGIQGASTITQQFVRQTVLKDEANDMTLRRKVREAYLAMEIEEVYSKETVLMMYLNTINYGDGAYGIQSAAQHYFSKNAAELNLGEAALLAGIPQRPTYNNPVLYPENALARRNAVLDRMQVNDYITAEECEQTKATPLNLVVNDKPDDGIYAAHYFTSYVRNLLEAQFTTDAVFRSGLTVYTTIDMNLQRHAEEVCVEKESRLPSDAEVSLTAVEPSTGYIRVMRGGKDFYADQYSSSTDMHRQPGSTFKPFALVSCLEQGFSPDTPVSGATPFTYNGWSPQNYANTPMGMLTLASATRASSNVAYGRVVRTIGAERIVEVAHRMGIVSDLSAVPAIVLGGAEGVNTLEMASAYGTLATGGVHNEPIAIQKVLDVDGNLIFEATPSNTQALTPEVACAATEVLEGVVTSGTGTSARLYGQVSAGKTGTSENFRDSWYVGYTPQLSTAVWVGARVEQPLTDNLGGANCCPVWRNFMEYALQSYPAADFPTAAAPTYRSDATFLTPEEKAKAEEEAKKKAEEEEAARKEEEEKQKQEEEQQSSGSGTGTTPGTGGNSGTGEGGTGTTPPPNPGTTGGSSP